MKKPPKPGAWTVSVSRNQQKYQKGAGKLDRECEQVLHAASEIVERSNKIGEIAELYVEDGGVSAPLSNIIQKINNGGHMRFFPLVVGGCALAAEVATQLAEDVCQGGDELWEIGRQQAGAVEEVICLRDLGLNGAKVHVVLYLPSEV